MDSVVVMDSDLDSEGEPVPSNFDGAAHTLVSGSEAIPVNLNGAPQSAENGSGLILVNFDGAPQNVLNGIGQTPVNLNGAPQGLMNGGGSIPVKFVMSGSESISVNVDGTGYVPEPKVGMMFDSMEMFINYYKKYGEKRGFPVCQRSSKGDKNGDVRWVTLACQRNGKTRTTSDAPLPPNFNVKTQCKARLNGRVETDGKIRLTSYVLEHNHALTPDTARFFPGNKNLNSSMKRKLLVDDHNRKRVRNLKSPSGGGRQSLSFAGTDCRSFVENAARLQLRAGDSEALCNFFTNMQKKDSNFWHAIDLDDDGRLRNVFWADARSRALYEQFGDVVTLDTTYQTEMYDVPLVPLIGVNHHGQSILFGCGLISGETTGAFSWLLRNWMASVNYHAPKAVITDRGTALQNAIAEVFPEARHRWCLWHIMKRVLEKFRSYLDYQAIKSALRSAIYDSKTEEEFEKKWESLVEKHNLQDNQWLAALFSERSCWAPVFVKDVFWAGMSIVQKSDTLLPFFDGFVSSKMTVKQFVERYDAVIHTKAEAEALADYNSFNSVRRCVTKYNIEKQFQDMYTNEKFKELQDELAGKMYCNVQLQKKEGAVSTYQVVEDEEILDTENDGIYIVFLNEEEFSVNCVCKLFECKGILCRHVLAVLTHSKIKAIPPKYILSRWRKDMRRAQTAVRVDKFNSLDDSQRRRYHEMYKQYYDVVDFAVGSDYKTNIVLKTIYELRTMLENSDNRVEKSPQFTHQANGGSFDVEIGGREEATGERQAG